MKPLHRTLLAAALLAAAPLLLAEVTESSIGKQLEKLRSLAPDKRPAATLQLALDIRALPAGMARLKLADALCHLSTEGDAGADTLQAVADTLAKSLADSPMV